MSWNAVGHFSSCPSPAQDGCWKGHAWGLVCKSPGWAGHGRGLVQQEGKGGCPGLHEELTTQEHQ